VQRGWLQEHLGKRSPLHDALPAMLELAMNRITPEPYRAYSPAPFTAAERERVTILFGGLHWRAERMLEGVFERRGYRARSLPAPTREDLVKGRELADIGQCCPTTFTTGNLANFLLREAERTNPEAVIRDYVYLTAGSCGACRFGQYHQSYELALRNIGMDAFRMFLMGQDELDQGASEGGGLELDMPLLLGATAAVLCADVIQDLEYQLRPYEVEEGATERAVRAAVEELHDAVLRCPRHHGKWHSLAWHLGTGHFARALERARRHFEAIEVDRLRVKPKVKITGEFYLQTVEGAPNHDIHRWLETEGAEVYPAAVVVWFDYLLRYAEDYCDERRGILRGAALKAAGLRLASRLLRRFYDRLRAALLSIPHPLPDQRELHRLAAPFYDHRLSGGEGDMLIGKALWAHLNRKAHMICELSPYSCMPNTMSTGAMAAALGQHPDLLYAPLEIKGDAEVHVLSRCQMVLTEAKSRAQKEFDAALAKTGMTLDEARRRIDDRPEMKRALWRVPHRGAAGTAANVVLELAGARL
jgi:predicted nucleotide-binding protein (sugar kinase/HSP70/actin superfamily)